MSFCGGACTSSGDRLMAHSHTGAICVVVSRALLLLQPLLRHLAVAHSLLRVAGAIHMWLRSAESSVEAGTSDHQPWIPTSTPSGHFAPVSDLKVPPLSPPTLLSHPQHPSLALQWSRDGSYLVSVSEDQTARSWAFDCGTGAGRGGWREVARPQVIVNFFASINALRAFFHPPTRQHLSDSRL